VTLFERSPHRFANRRSVRTTEVLSESLVAFSRKEYADYHGWLRRSLGVAGRKLRVGEECDGVLSLIAAVEADRGLAVSAECVMSVAGSRVVFVPLKPAPPLLDVGVCYLAGNPDFAAGAALRFSREDECEKINWTKDFVVLGDEQVIAGEHPSGEGCQKEERKKLVVSRGELVRFVVVSGIKEPTNHRDHRSQVACLLGESRRTQEGEKRKQRKDPGGRDFLQLGMEGNPAKRNAKEKNHEKRHTSEHLEQVGRNGLRRGRGDKRIRLEEVFVGPHPIRKPNARALMEIEKPGAEYQSAGEQDDEPTHDRLPAILRNCEPCDERQHNGCGYLKGAGESRHSCCSEEPRAPTFLSAPQPSQAKGEARRACEEIVHPDLSSDKIHQRIGRGGRKGEKKNASVTKVGWLVVK